MGLVLAPGAPIAAASISAVHCVQHLQTNDGLALHKLP